MTYVTTFVSSYEKSTVEKNEDTAAVIERTSSIKPPDGVAVKTDDCPLGLKPGQVVYINGDDVQFYGEKSMKDGTRVTFTRYLYGKTTWGWGDNQYVHKIAFFRFPDRSERSLMKTSIRIQKITDGEIIIELEQWESKALQAMEMGDQNLARKYAAFASDLSSKLSIRRA